MALFQVLFRFCLTVLLAIASSQALRAEQPTRNWDFDIKTPGTYKLQIEHAMTEASGTKVSYTISIGSETRTRELELVADRPFIPLVADVPATQKMRVAITGLPEAALKQTRVYAYNADYVPYGEYFDPTNDSGLQEVERVRKILSQPDEKIDLGRVKLTIDKLVSPSIDIEQGLKQIDAMVRKIRAMPEFGVTATSRAIALQRYIYTAGA